MRLRVEVVLEIAGAQELSGAAVGRIENDEFMPEEERAHARSSVHEDSAEALAYLIEPFDLVRDVPGVDLVQASWTSEEVDYDPDAQEWELDEEDGDEEDDEESA